MTHSLAINLFIIVTIETCTYVQYIMQYIHFTQPNILNPNMSCGPAGSTLVPLRLHILGPFLRCLPAMLLRRVALHGRLQPAPKVYSLALGLCADFFKCCFVVFVILNYCFVLFL